MRKLTALVACLALAGPLDAGKGGSSSGGSSSRPSSSGLSGGSKPVSRPPSSGLSGASRPSPPKGVSGLSGGSKPAPSKPAPSSGLSGGSKPPVKSATPLPGKAPVSVSKKPAAVGFNQLGADATKREESRRNYEKAAAPAPTYRTPKGEARPVPPKDPEVEYLRGRLDGERWASRPRRVDDFYAPYRARPPVAYSDPYHPMMNYWLMGQSLDVATLWLYHHKASMDRARYDALLAQNADLRSRVASMDNLERAGHAIPRDPTWTPKGVDPDVVYDDGFVTAGYNPTPKEVEEYEYAADDGEGGGLATWAKVLILALAVGAVVFLIFVVRWGP